MISTEKKLREMNAISTKRGTKSNEPLRRPSQPFGREGEPVLYAIMSAADINEEAARDIQQILENKYSDYNYDELGEETEFASDSYYEEKGVDDESGQEEWHNFEYTLKSETRFFSRTAMDYLMSVFDKIDMMRTREDHSIVIDAGPGTPFEAFYRARVFQTDKQLKDALIRPDQHLGPPPSVCAKAGRMNAHGIAVFYGSNNPEVAIAEVRPPVGSWVGVARFELVRGLKLLDLTAMRAVVTYGSIFDPTFSDRLGRAMFLRNLSLRISKPVMPEDELFDYIATQAVADFLATESSVHLDGILFPAAQTSGASHNVVLFNKAARVEKIDLPVGTEVRASLGTFYEDGWEDEFTVIEEIPPRKAKDEEVTEDINFGYQMRGQDEGLEASLDNSFPSTLRIDMDSVTVHKIQAVQFSTNKRKVSRHRWEKKEVLF